LIGAKSTASIFKPGILFLLVISAVASYILAGGWSTNTEILLYILLFGAMAGGSANILNNYIDRKTDRLMERTRNRAIPSRTVSPGEALAAGIIIGSASVILFWVYVNPLTAFVALGGIIFYAVIYSIILKQRTAQNIVLGGFAAMFPPLVAWTSVTNTIALVPLFMGIIVVLWTPPHFWALALVHKKDYKKAGIPMMPVVIGAKATRDQIVLYSAAMLAVSIVFTFAGGFGYLYLGAALVMGIPFLGMALQLQKSGTDSDAKKMFNYSIIYLIILFAAMIADYMIL
jgi:protoheme IX farnesyltransferase